MTSALLAIDIQQSFWQRPNIVEVSAPDIVDRTNRLTDWARAHDVEVIWILHSEPGSDTVFDPRQGFVEPHGDLIIRDDEVTMTKTSRNAFTTTRLEQHLRLGGIDHLYISGIQTEQCCETTARLAADLGFEVTFVLDATATFPISSPVDGASLSTEAIIERTAFALRGRFADVVSMGDVIEQATPV